MLKLHPDFWKAYACEGFLNLCCQSHIICHLVAGVIEPMTATSIANILRMIAVVVADDKIGFCAIYLVPVTWRLGEGGWGAIRRYP